MQRGDRLNLQGMRIVQIQNKNSKRRAARTNSQRVHIYVISERNRTNRRFES